MPRSRVPLPTLLSHVLVALTVSLDNEFEARMPHTTTMGKKRGLGTPGPWLVSWPMWVNFLRFIGPEGIRVADLWQECGVGERSIHNSHPGLVRWGYVTVDPPPGAASARPRLEDMIVCTTAAGRRAQAIWQELPALVEPSWRSVLGASNLDALRTALLGVLDQVDVELPRYLTIGARPYPPRQSPVDALDLTALLSGVLELFTMDYEAEASHGLFVAANLLRVVDADGTPVRDLPRRSGISKEAINLTISYFTRRRFAFVEPDSKVSGQKIARLTPEGLMAKSTYERLPTEVERRWARRFGKQVAALRTATESIVGSPVLSESPLAALVKPYPDGWRSWVKRPETLPHHPQPNPRGGFPDGV